MSIVNIQPDASEAVSGIVETARTALKQLKDGKRACTGEAPMHLLVGLHGYLRGLNKTWASFNLISLDQGGNLTLTSKGQEVQTLLAQREGDPNYSLLVGYQEMQQAGSNLTALIEDTIGTAPAQYTMNALTGFYEINKPDLPELATAIEGVIQLLEG